MADGCSLNEYDLSEAARRYGLPKETLRSFATDYQVLHRSRVLPAPEEPLGMTAEELAREVGIPAKAIRLLQEHGALDSPLTHGDWAALEALARVWGRRRFVELQIVRWSSEERAALGHPRRTPSAPDRWIYYRYLEGGRDGRVWLEDVIVGAEELYGASDDEEMRRRIRQMRKAVYNDRLAARSKGVAVEELARRRFCGTGKGQ